MTRTPDHTHLAALLACVQLGLRHEIAQHLAGQPRAQHFDGDKTTGGGGSDPTATAATTPDKARHDLEQHDAAIDRAYRALLTLAALSDKYLPAHEPTRRDVLNETKGCTWHQQAGVEQHQQAWRYSDCGFLTAKVHLCHACYDYAKRSGQRPTNEQIILHAKGKGWVKRTTGKRASVFTAQQIADEWNGAA